MLRKVTYLIVLISFLGINSVFAEWEKPKVNLSSSYRYLIREKHSIYIQRGELDFSYRRDAEKFSRLKLSPFIELRNNIQRDRLEHREVGIEIGVDIFDWLYVGESFQYTRYNYDWANWLWHPRIKYAAEAETRVMLSAPVYQISEGKKIIAYALNEFTYSFKLSEGTRNEAVLGVAIPVAKHVDIGFDWRHIDRIHDFDSDAIEATVNLVF